jgi:hypothetical protein
MVMPGDNMTIDGRADRADRDGAGPALRDPAKAAALSAAASSPRSSTNRPSEGWPRVVCEETCARFLLGRLRLRGGLGASVGGWAIDERSVQDGDFSDREA